MRLRHLEENAMKEVNEPEVLQFVVTESKKLNGEKVYIAFEESHLRKLRRNFPGVVIHFPARAFFSGFVREVRCGGCFEALLVPEGNQRRDNDV